MIGSSKSFKQPMSTLVAPIFLTSKSRELVLSPNMCNMYHDKMLQIKKSNPQLKKYLYISAKIWRSPRIIPHTIKPGKITATLQGSPQPNKSTSLREWTQISLEIWNSLRNTTLVKVKLLRKLLPKWFTTGNKNF